MKISSYNPTTMDLLLSDTTTVDFGNSVRGTHAPNVVVIKPVAETETITTLAMFLEDNADLNHTSFERFSSSTAITGIEPGDPRFSNFFILAAGISDVSQIPEYSDYGLMLTPSDPEYVWMDALVGSNESTYGASAINYRFLFEYV